MPSDSRTDLALSRGNPRPQASSPHNRKVGIRALRDIHLSGLIWGDASPGSVRGRAFQARRSAAGAWWQWPPGSGLGVDDEIAVADWVVGHGELEHAVEEHPPAARSAAVEAEHE